MAAATVLTLAEASSEAAAAAAARSEVPLTLAVISPATRCMSSVALRDRADHALDVGLEAVGHLALQRLLLELGLLLGGLLRLAQGAGLQHVAAEHVDRLRHGAEFVLAVAAGDRHIGVAAREAVHHRGDRRQRPRQAAAEQERQHNGAGQNGKGAENAGCAASWSPPPRIRWCP